MKGFERPDFTILSESSAIPDANLVAPPDAFTHELTRDEPYWYERAENADANGRLAAGTKVVLVEERDGRCRVVDPRGLAVTIAGNALRKL
jgi:hypothetical protein